MYNGIIKFTPRIGKIYPQGVNLPPVENPCSKAYRKPKALNCRWNNFIFRLELSIYYKQSFTQVLPVHKLQKSTRIDVI